MSMNSNFYYEQLISRSYQGGKIIGISPAPKLGYSEGLYAVVSFPNKACEYYPAQQVLEELQNDS